MTTSVLELAYARSSMFGRDLFHYGVSAVVFSFCLLSPVLLKSFRACGSVSSCELTQDLDAWEKTGLTVGLILLSYALGHLLASIGFLYRALWRRSFRWTKHVGNLENAEERLESMVSRDPLSSTTSNSAADGEQAPMSTSDVHVFYEMEVLRKLPEVHATFVERYNTLAFLRLGLASSVLTAGFACLVLPCLKIAPAAYAISLGLFWVAAGVLLLRQHLITQTNFLNRVAAGYALAEDSR